MIRSEWFNGQMDLTVPLELRREVFGTERDDFDEFAMITVFYVDEVPVGTGRIFYDNGAFRVDSIGVIENYRKQHIGDLMSRLLLYKCQQFAEEVILTTPTEYTGFFVRYGFGLDGEPFAEDGVQKVNMRVKKDDIYFPSECKSCCC